MRLRDVAVMVAGSVLVHAAVTACSGDDDGAAVAGSSTAPTVTEVACGKGVARLEVPGKTAAELAASYVVVATPGSTWGTGTSATIPDVSGTTGSFGVAPFAVADGTIEAKCAADGEVLFIAR